jgi:flagellar protein FlgJ
MAVSPTSSLSADIHGIDALRATAAKDPKAAIKEAAKQFEALFMQQLMKSMREATMSSGMLDNEGTKLGTEMLDTQFATKMTGLPGGLSEVIARQLERQMSGAQPAIPAAAATGAKVGDASPSSSQAVQADFVRTHTAAARSAEAQTGIPAAFMVAQAAHESGWGKREIRHADGSSANNLFGIKAGANWTGKVAEITTTEYVDGEARKVTAKFRAYNSPAESFADYAQLMKTSPRYTGVLANAGSAQGFAQGLQQAGYATDPAYADKLTRVINTTLRMQRAMT